MNLIWRFYRDDGRQRRWQRLSADRTVIAESNMGYTDYEVCVVNAQGKGYVFHPTQLKTTRGQVR